MASIKPIAIILLQTSLLGITAVSTTSYASPAYLPAWIKGEMNCKIDGRPAKMTWKIENRYEGNCDSSGEYCTQAEYAVSVGSFSDNGGQWIPLESRGSRNNGNTFLIRYKGAEPDNWELTFVPSTEVATGWTTWRGNRYSLSCWKGDVPLPERCDAYATNAVQQYQSAQRLFCGIPTDARWQDNRNAHYNWCMQSKGNPAWLNAENKARSDALAQCRRTTVGGGIRHNLPR